MRKLFYLFALIGILLLSMLLNACKASYHFQKFQAKGGKIECDIDTLKVIDTLVINGNTIIKVRDSLVVRNQIEYVTKWETKYKYKEAKVKEKEETKRNKEENKTERVEAKQDGKTDRNESNNNRKIENNFGKWIGLLVMAFILGFFARHFLPLVIRIFKPI